MEVFSQTFGRQCLGIVTLLDIESPPGSDDQHTLIDASDLIEVQMRKELKTLRLRNIRYFNLNLSISSATRAPFRMENDNASDPKMYKVFQDWERPHLLPFRLVKLDNVALVEARVNCRWQPLEVFLETLATSTPSYHQQSSFWEHCDRETCITFAFKALPLEIRRKIYNHAIFGESRYKLFPYRYSNDIRRIWKHTAEGPSPRNINLFLVDRQINLEATQEAYTFAEFVFRSAKDFTSFVRVLARLGRLGFIRAVRLELNFHQLYRLLGPSQRLAGLACLRKMKALNCFSIAIPGPSALQSSKFETDTYGCHTKTTQDILDSITPFLLHLAPSQIEISGLIKRPQKRRYTRYLERVAAGGVTDRNLGPMKHGSMTPGCFATCTCRRRCNDPAVSDTRFGQEYLDDDDDSDESHRRERKETSAKVEVHTPEM